MHVLKCIIFILAILAGYDVACQYRQYSIIDNVDDKKFYTNEGRMEQEEISKIVYDSIDQILYMHHFTQGTDFVQFLSKYDVNGNLLKRKKIHGNNDDFNGSSKWIKSGDELIFTYNLLPSDSLGFYIYKYNTELDSIVRYKYTTPKDSTQYDIIINGLIEYKQYYLAYGWTRSNQPQLVNRPAKLFWINKYTMALDTVTSIHYGDDGFQLQECIIDTDGNLTCNYWSTEDVGSTRFKNRVGLLKINDRKEVIWKWDSHIEKDNLGYYSFCQLADKSYVFERYGTADYFIKGSQNFPFSLLNLTSKKDSLWNYNMDRSYNKRAKFVLKLKEAKNGDILGCGSMTWHYRELDPKDYAAISDLMQALKIGKLLGEINSPYIFRLSKDGHKIWDRAVILVDSFDQVTTGKFNDLQEMDDGTIVYAGSAGTYTSQVENQDRGLAIHNRDSYILRISGDGCYLDFPCSPTKAFLQPSRSLSYFHTGNLWLLKNEDKGSSTYARFAPDKKIIDGEDYYVLQYSKTKSEDDWIDTAYFTMNNERIFQYKNQKLRPLFDYHSFECETWNDVLTIDTSYFTNLNTYRTKLYQYSSDKDSTIVYHWYNGVGCIEDFFFDSYNAKPDNERYKICKYWHDGTLVYNDSLSNCVIDHTVETPSGITIKYYPNPVENILYLETSKKDVSLEIFNMAGQLIVSKKINYLDQYHTADMPSGLYTVLFKDTDGTIIKSDKVIK